jgi:8-oxo-dGTP pyrophosphatase MutT (NUDIX family)
VLECGDDPLSPPVTPDDLLEHPGDLRLRIADKLFDALLREPTGPAGVEAEASSAVLFLLGCFDDAAGRAEPCVVLTKRSKLVRQPGDLCFPGGGVSLRIDTLLAPLLRLPRMPLRRWSHYRPWRHGAGDRRLPIVLAAALREAFEEMRVNPLATSFLGLLPPQPLYMRGRAIRPAVAWLDRTQRFQPNWEVDRVVVVPMRHLLDPSHYARLRVTFAPGLHPGHQPAVREFPCVVLKAPQGHDLLWGATYRIVNRLLALVFDFEEPALEQLQERVLHLDETYLGASRDRNR